jgi:hypothetical protein
MSTNRSFSAPGYRDGAVLSLTAAAYENQVQQRVTYGLAARPASIGPGRLWDIVERSRARRTTSDRAVKIMQIPLTGWWERLMSLWGIAGNARGWVLTSYKNCKTDKLTPLTLRIYAYQIHG